MRKHRKNSRIGSSSWTFQTPAPIPSQPTPAPDNNNGPNLIPCNYKWNKFWIRRINLYSNSILNKKPGMSSCRFSISRIRLWAGILPEVRVCRKRRVCRWGSNQNNKEDLPIICIDNLKINNKSPNRFPRADGGMWGGSGGCRFMRRSWRLLMRSLNKCQQFSNHSWKTI